MHTSFGQYAIGPKPLYFHGNNVTIGLTYYSRKAQNQPYSNSLFLMLKQHLNILMLTIDKQGCLIPRQHLFTNSIYSLLLVILFSYKHVVCFDLPDPSCLQKCKQERYNCKASSDCHNAGYRDYEVALHETERTHEQ